VKAGLSSARVGIEVRIKTRTSGVRPRHPGAAGSANLDDHDPERRVARSRHAEGPTWT